MEEIMLKLSSFEEKKIFLFHASVTLTKRFQVFGKSNQ